MAHLRVAAGSDVNPCILPTRDRDRERGFSVARALIIDDSQLIYINKTSYVWQLAGVCIFLLRFHL